MAMIVLVVCLALLVPTAQNIGDMTNTITLDNETIGTVATNTSTVYLTNYRAVSDAVLYNITDDAIVPSTNYTLTNNVVYNDALATRIVFNLADVEDLTGYSFNISGTAQPLSYASDSASRSMASLIVILASIGILGYSVYHFSKGFSNF